MHAEDQSGHLNKYGFWSSFNEVYYAATASIAGVQVDYYYEQVRFKLFDERQVLVNSSLTLTPTPTPTPTLTLTLPASRSPSSSTSTSESPRIT